MKNTILLRLVKPLMVLATIIWGSSFIVLKDTLNYMSVLFILAMRFSIGAVILLLVKRKAWKTIDRTSLLGGTVMGVLLFVAYVLQTFGLADTTPGKNAFFTSVYCIIVPFLYWAIERNRPDRYHLLAALFCVTGIGFVSWDGGFFLSEGDCLTLISGFLYAVHIIAVTHFTKGRDALLLTAIQFTVTALLSWLFVPLQGFPQGDISSYAWLGILYLGVFSTAIALSFQNIGQKYTEPSVAAVLLSLEAPFGVLFSVLFYQERPTGFMFCGFGLIFLAVICSETKFSFLPFCKSKQSVTSSVCHTNSQKQDE